MLLTCANVITLAIPSAGSAHYEVQSAGYSTRHCTGSPNLIIVSGALFVAEDNRAEYLAGCLDVIMQARAAPGCLDFVLSADPIEPDRINVYERWESDAQLEQFRGAGPDTGQQAQIRDAQVSKYRISAIESP